MAGTGQADAGLGGAWVGGGGPYLAVLQGVLVCKKSILDSLANYTWSTYIEGMKTIEEIAAKLESAGCEVSVWKDERVYVRKTPNGKRGDYGYCVEGEDPRDICEGISKRRGEIMAILRTEEVAS